MHKRWAFNYTNIIVIGDYVIISVAPARGATISIDIIHTSIDVSIHAPARGATFFSIHARWVHFHSTCFNPRTARVRQLIVSIHAPARGAIYTVGIQ